MSVRVTLYHNPRCSKSREALRLLRERGVEPEIIEYLKHPPDAATVEQLLQMLDLEPRELMRRQEPEYQQAGLNDPSLSRAELVAAMVQYPKLLERPVAVHGSRAIVGRPPEKVLELLTAFP